MRLFNRINRIFITWSTCRQRGVLTDGSVHLVGRPIIDVKDGCTLFIGSDVTLNSRNCGYHINMHSPVKLMADRQGAEIRIGSRTRIHGSCIHAYQRVTIGEDCLIAANCQIFDGNGHDLSFPDVERRNCTRGVAKPVVIEDSVWIGANSIVTPGVRIGKGSVIAAGSVVIKDIPEMTLAGGNPAVVIRNYANHTVSGSKA